MHMVILTSSQIQGDSKKTGYNKFRGKKSVRNEVRKRFFSNRLMDTLTKLIN